MAQDSGGSNLKKESDYYYDGNNTSLTTPPAKGNLTRKQQYKDTSISISSYYSYDSYGNRLTEQDPNGNITSWTYDNPYNIYPATKTYPAVTGGQFHESYTYDAGTNNLLTQTGINGGTITYVYDTFKRLLSIDKPLGQNPDIQYSYNSWGTPNQQNIKTITNIDATHSLWQKEYFDGLGRVIQTQSSDEPVSTHVIVSSTTEYNAVGLVAKQYVSQDLTANPDSTYYVTPDTSWNYTSYIYDGLSRAITQINADNTTVSSDYSIAWKTTSTNERGYKENYYYDAFRRLVKVEELNGSQQVYSTNNLSYDVLDNLTDVYDNSNNHTQMTYDWLSRKTGMNDPDMSTWNYTYDGNGNLLTQTDAKSQTIQMAYDALNRLTTKTYPAGLGMANLSYAYDSTSDGNYGKGKRTGMTDALGTNSATFKYDTRGRLIQESKVIDSNTYTTGYTYNGTDQIYQIAYPSGEVVTQGYNGRGLPYSLTGNMTGNLVDSVLYNGLGSLTEINLHTNPSGLKTTYSYWGIDHQTTSYGRLWEIKTFIPGSNPIQDVQQTWDAGGNLIQRQDLVSSETETFSYDFLDRLTNYVNPVPPYSPGDANGDGIISTADADYVVGVYMGYNPPTAGCDANQDGNINMLDVTAIQIMISNQGYSYNALGNILLMKGNSYTYNTNGTRPHAVTAVGSTSYAYDNNGNMTTRGSQTIGWDVENRVISVTGGATFIYDGDGNRVKKTEGGQTIIYVNKYFEKNITSNLTTTNYYLGNNLIAQRNGTTLNYILQDHLGSTSVTADSSGNTTGTLRYFPFGLTRSSSGSLPTDKKFTGQRLDSTGLYYYGTRYYDPQIGRFISPDTIASEPANPQTLNRYSYCLNNPLKYIDPTGRTYEEYMRIYGGQVGYWGGNGGGSGGVPRSDLPLWKNGDYANWALKSFPFRFPTIEAWNKFSEGWGHKYDGYIWVTGSGWIYVGGLGGVTSGGPTGLGQQVTMNEHITKDIVNRGWVDEQTIRNTIENPVTTRMAVNTETGNPATAYYRSLNQWDYVVVDNVTKGVVQISNANDTTWLPPPSIFNPIRAPVTFPNAGYPDPGIFPDDFVPLFPE